MNTRFKYSLIATAIAAFAAVPAWAADQGAQAPNRAAQERTYPPVDPTMREAPARDAARGGESKMQRDISDLTPGDLEGQTVVGADGKSVGEVESVVSAFDQQGVEVVISVGGVFGIGAKEAAIPLDQLQIIDGKLTTAQSEDELAAASEQYKKENYMALEPKDQPISEFSAFEPMPGGDMMPGDPAAPTSPAEIMPRATPEKPR